MAYKPQLFLHKCTGLNFTRKYNYASKSQGSTQPICIHVRKYNHTYIHITIHTTYSGGFRKGRKGWPY